MMTGRNAVILIAGVAVGLLLAVGASMLTPFKKTATTATNGSQATAPVSSNNVPPSTVLTMKSANTPFSIPPQINPATPPAYTYNSKGQLTAIVYPDGSVYTYRYDIHGDKIGEESRSGQTWTYLYDKSHKPIATIDPKGNMISASQVEGR
jgi:YD repeat-containing protein